MVVPKMTRRRGSDAGQPRRRRVRSCKECSQALHEDFSFRFIQHVGERPREGCERVNYTVRSSIKQLPIYIKSTNNLAD